MNSETKFNERAGSFMWTVPDFGDPARFTLAQQLGLRRPQTLELLDRIEVATGWVGPILCIETLYPTAGGFATTKMLADFERLQSELSRSLGMPSASALEDIAPEFATATEQRITEGR